MLSSMFVLKSAGRVRDYRAKSVVKTNIFMLRVHEHPMENFEFCSGNFYFRKCSKLSRNFSLGQPWLDFIYFVFSMRIWF